MEPWKAGRKSSGMPHFAGIRHRNPAWLLIVVGQCLQEGHHILDFLTRQSRFIAAMAVKGRVADVHIGTVRRRQIVIHLYRAVGLVRIPLLGPRLPLHVEPDDVFEGVEYAIVKKYLPRSDIAQCGCFEEPAKALHLGQILPGRATCAFIKELWIAIYSEIPVAWCSQR